MPGIAIKYWAFQQDGWGHVDEGQIPPTPEPEVEGRSDYQDWKWIGASGELLKSPKKPILHIEPRILTVLNFYTYTTEEYEIQVRAQEKLPFVSTSKNIVECESVSTVSANLYNYLSVGIGEPRKHINSSIYTYKQTPEFGYEHKENIILQWSMAQYREGNARPRLPLALSVHLRERQEHRMQAALPIPFHIRTPLLEYVRWRLPLTMTLSDGVNDETLLAALAHIIIDIEESGEI